MRRGLVLAALLLALAGCAANRDSGGSGVSGAYVGGALGGNARQSGSWR